MATRSAAATGPTNISFSSSRGLGLGEQFINTLRAAREIAEQGITNPVFSKQDFQVGLSDKLFGLHAKPIDVAKSIVEERVQDGTLDFAIPPLERLVSEILDFFETVLNRKNEWHDYGKQLGRQAKAFIDSLITFTKAKEQRTQTGPFDPAELIKGFTEVLNPENYTIQNLTKDLGTDLHKDPYTQGTTEDQETIRRHTGLAFSLKTLVDQIPNYLDCVLSGKSEEKPVNPFISSNAIGW